MDRAQQRVDRHGRRHIRGAAQALGVGQRQRQHRGRELRAVDEREAFLRAELDRRQAVRGERREPGHAVHRFALADQHQREVRERREIAAGPHRAAARHARVHAVVEQREQRVERLDADAGISFRQHVGAQRHRRAHRAHRERRIDAGGMTAQQVQLQLREVGLVDPRFREIAEAGVHAVDRRITGGLRLHHRARRRHARARVGREADLDAIVGDGEQVGEFEMRTVEKNHRHQFRTEPSLRYSRDV